MVDDHRFRQLIQEIRQGDERAAEELVRAYEPHVRRVIRVRMDDLALRKAVDSMDICQSVLASFFVRAATGQYEINAPAQLVQLLATMARNKLQDCQRKQRAARRDVKREMSLDDESRKIALLADDTSPSNAAAAKELLHRVHELLPDTERRMATQWAAGVSWEEIAKREGKSPDALRMQLRRSFDRVAMELKLQD